MKLLLVVVWYNDVIIRISERSADKRTRADNDAVRYPSSSNSAINCTSDGHQLPTG